MVSQKKLLSKITETPFFSWKLSYGNHVKNLHLKYFWQNNFLPQKQVIVTKKRSMTEINCLQRKNGTETSFFHTKLSVRKPKFVRKWVYITENISLRVSVKGKKFCHRNRFCHIRSFPPPTMDSVGEKKLLSQRQVDRNLIYKDIVLT